jgi:alcohol dehydrogenase, propanol-preferring
MRAAVLERPRAPLSVREIETPAPGPGQILVKVNACGVCRTDLHIVDGELSEPKLPLVPGHQIAGTVVETGEGAKGLSVGQRVGIPWLGSTCGKCAYCASGRENLCPNARFTGYHMDGGFAEYVAADPRFAFPLPEDYPDLQMAPLLCGGLIGYRALRMTGQAGRIGFYGFGSAAHILAQVCKHQGREVYAFTRPGDANAKALAIRVGASWAGDAGQQPPASLLPVQDPLGGADSAVRCQSYTRRRSRVPCSGSARSRPHGSASVPSERRERGALHAPRWRCCRLCRDRPRPPVN